MVEMWVVVVGGGAGGNVDGSDGSMESNVDVVVDGNNDDGCDGNDGKSIVVVSVYSKASLR